MEDEGITLTHDAAFEKRIRISNVIADIFLAIMLLWPLLLGIALYIAR